MRQSSRPTGTERSGAPPAYVMGKLNQRSAARRNHRLRLSCRSVGLFKVDASVSVCIFAARTRPRPQ